MSAIGPPSAVTAFAATALLAAHVPLLAEHFGHLWLKPHYRFLPFVLIGSVVLAWVGPRARPVPGRAALAGPGLLLAGLLFAAAVVMASSWLAAVSALATLAAAGYAAAGPQVCGRLWPAWALLWLLVPPPLELDRDLIVWLQGWTARWSTAALDVFGVYHVMAGHVVELDGRRLLVEDACSGVNSLFSVLACAAFLLLLTRCPPVRAGLVLAAAVGWVLVANAARVAGIALLMARWNVDVSTGWKHEAFGLALFACAVGLTLSTERLLAFLLDPSEPPKPSERAATTASPGAGGWLVVAAAPAFLALMGLHLSATRATEVPGAEVRPEGLALETMPEMIGGWKRQDFETPSRDVGSYFGDHSRVWRYRQGERTALFSLDYPFPGWHDLTRCYTGQGWQLDGQEVYDDLPGGYVAVRLSKPGYRHGYLLFCEFNAAGEPLPARRGATGVSLFRHRSVLRGWLGHQGEVDPPAPVYQWQVMADGHAAPTEAECAALREAFVAGRATVLRALR